MKLSELTSKLVNKLSQFDLANVPVVNIPLVDVSTDPLDLLVTGLALRMKQLARTNPQFVEMVYNKKFRIEMGVIDGLARQISVDHGQISTEPAGAEKADFKLNFSDTDYAVKTLLKGDPAAFMTGMQAGKIKMEGDFSLLMWFNQAAKLLVPAVPSSVKQGIKQVREMLESKSVKGDDTDAAQAEPKADTHKEPTDSAKKSESVDTQSKV